MGVRYLFGDSGLFPGSNNFLEILRGFIIHVGRAAMVHAEIQAKERAVGEAVGATSQRLDAVAGYFQAVIPEIEEAAHGRPDSVRPLAVELGEFAQRLHDSTRSRALAELESIKEATARDTASLRAEIPACLNNFFVSAPLEEKGWAFSLRRSVEHADASTVVTFPQGIEAAFVLDHEHEWGRPRKVGELATDINIQIGMKKKFLSKSLVPERTYLNDFFIASIELADEVTEVVLRRKLELDEGLMIRVHTPLGEPPTGEIIKTGGQDEVLTATPEDAAELRRLVDAIREVVSVTIRRRRRLLWVRLGTQDVLEAGLLLEMIEALVDTLAPLAQEISRRSPNRHELSLKVEHSDGRREEIYLKKDELAAPLAGLPSPMWKIFGRLGVLPAAS
ncbi:MAG: hypothetical protein H6710_15785 [Myxococcales bacterium]|nr:hypothetical protein [Myxococcales bacterium]MCB9705974.1 hypothetical protein [Myxococcales bacterium]